MFHIPVHKNLQNPPAQIREGELQVSPQALQARRNEMYGRKARRADQIIRERINVHEQAREMVRKAMQRAEQRQ